MGLWFWTICILELQLRGSISFTVNIWINVKGSLCSNTTFDHMGTFRPAMLTKVLLGMLCQCIGMDQHVLYHHFVHFLDMLAKCCPHVVRDGLTLLRGFKQKKKIQTNYLKFYSIRLDSYIVK